MQKTAPPSFCLAEAKEIILTAFSNFDPLLGQRAQNIFAAGYGYNSALKGLWNDKARYFADVAIREQDARHLAALETGTRWRLANVKPGQAFMMRSRPAQTPASAQGDPASPHDYAVIDYQFDGSLNGVVYMAHEVGHAIADDCIHAYGKSYNDSPHEIDEVQGYLPQLVVYNHLGGHPNPRIAEAAQQHRADLMAKTTGGRGAALKAAQTIFELAQDKSKRAAIIETLMGARGPKNIAETIAAGCRVPSKAVKLSI